MKHSLNSHRIGLSKKLLLFVCCTFLFLLNNSKVHSEDKINNKIIVENSSQLPSYNYLIDDDLVNIVSSDEKFNRLSNEVERDIKNTLEKYSIMDISETKRLYSVLYNIYILSGDYDSAINAIERIREYQLSEIDSMMTGVVALSVISAKEDKPSSEVKFWDQYKKYLGERLQKIEFTNIEKRIIEMIQDSKTYSENLIQAILVQALQPQVDSSGSINDHIAQQLITMKYMIDITIPLNSKTIEVCEDLLATYKNRDKIEKDSAYNDFNLQSSDNLYDVVVAIWDTGIDSNLFKDNLFYNHSELIDGLDNDNNGFIDDINCIGYNSNFDKIGGFLMSLEPLSGNIDDAISRAKGMTDLKRGINSDGAKYMQELYKSITPEKLKELKEDMTLFGIYYHGTGVASIAANGNPNIRLLSIRNSYSYKKVRTCPTIDNTYKEAKSFREIVDYMKKSNVRVANLSWGQSYSIIEKDLELNGFGDTVEDRKLMATSIYSIIEDTLYAVIKDSPEILFITGSTNFGNDAKFDQLIPSSFDLENLLVVGATNMYGEITDFSGEASNADIYGFGEYVKALIPGGDTLEMSGVSIATPSATNLAAKMLSLNPKLTPTEIIDLIIENANKNEKENILLLNQTSTIASLLKQKKDK